MSRADQLAKLLEKSPNDAFLLYGLAMEHKKAGRMDDAMTMLDRTTAADPNYAYAFYQKGQIFEDRGDVAGAKSAYREGVAAATRAGDQHGMSEIARALDMLG